ncbi:MAG: hypothetical protein OXF61_06970 [Acidimicrobiaceae bacterium]|nr:hypothetical protein [Acidimicrobiaceae bacterium]
MTDILIPDVPDNVLAVIDTNAAIRGVSRDEYVRNLLSREQDIRPQSARASAPSGQATESTHEEIREGLRRIAETYADARNPEIMAGAWR